MRFWRRWRERRALMPEWWRAFAGYPLWVMERRYGWSLPMGIYYVARTTRRAMSGPRQLATETFLPRMAMSRELLDDGHSILIPVRVEVMDMREWLRGGYADAAWMGVLEFVPPRHAPPRHAQCRCHINVTGDTDFEL